MVFLHVAACLTKTKLLEQSYSRNVAACLGETIISTFMLLFIASCLKKLSLCFPCFLGTRLPNDAYLYYLCEACHGKHFVRRLQVLYVFGVMGLELRDHHCYLLVESGLQVMLHDVALHFGSVDVTCCSRIPLALGLELITKDAELRKDPEIDALVVNNFSPSAHCKKHIGVVAVLPLRLC